MPKILLAKSTGPYQSAHLTSQILFYIAQTLFSLHELAAPQTQKTTNLLDIRDAMT